jgi:hypothetical protein
MLNDFSTVTGLSSSNCNDAKDALSTKDVTPVILFEAYNNDNTEKDNVAQKGTKKMSDTLYPSEEKNKFPKTNTLMFNDLASAELSLPYSISDVVPFNDNSIGVASKDVQMNALYDLNDSDFDDDNYAK